MDSVSNFDVFKDTKPLLVAAVYAAVACFMFLLIPFLPFIETFDGNVNLFKALFLLIEEMQNASDYLEPIEVILLLFSQGWFIFSFIFFTILFIIFSLPLLMNIKKIKQFAVYGTDKIYLSALIVLLSVFVEQFFFTLLLNMMYTDSGELIGVPNVYVVLYGAFAVIGLAVNFVCKNLIKPMRVAKKKILYHGVKIVLLIILMFIAAFSTLMHVQIGSMGYPLTLYSSSEMTSVFAKEGGMIYVNFGALVEIMIRSKADALFQDIVILIVAADVIFVFYTLLIAVYKFVSTNYAEIIDYIRNEGENAEMQFFYDYKAIQPIKDYSGLILMILGGATLIFHIGLFPIVRIIDGIEGIEFSIAPILSMIMLIFGAGIMFGTKYFNLYFCKEKDDTEDLSSKQGNDMNAKIVNVDFAAKEPANQTSVGMPSSVSATIVVTGNSTSGNENREPTLKEDVNGKDDDDNTSFFSDF